MREFVDTSFAYEKNFTKNVLAVVCISGLIRIILEFQINTSSFGDLDSMLDLLYLVIFSTTLFSLWKGISYESLRFVFYLPLIILLCLTLYNSRGLASPVETNTYLALIIISLTTRSIDAIRFSLLLIVGTLLSLILVESKYHFSSDFTDYSTENLNFIFISIVSVILTYYAKQVFEDRKNSLSNIKKSLSRNHRVLQESTDQLEAKTRELEELNRKLEAKVEERMTLLSEKKRALKEYLYLTSEELQIEYEGIYQLTDDSFGASNDQMAKMMIESSSKLDREIKSLVSKLKEDS
ncbi:MAG: hypothetical protein HRT61_25055 [Ekhidna sp.]|nr:hypothetical protein [Ekhidna sp.]